MCKEGRGVRFRHVGCQYHRDVSVQTVLEPTEHSFYTGLCFVFYRCYSFLTLVGIILSAFYREEDAGIEKGSKLREVTQQLGRGEARI